MGCSTGLDAIVGASLASFYLDICSSTWCGREREMISLYAFGHLVTHCTPGSVLSDPAQIGIEVAVRQLPADKDHRGRRGTVCKDLVIWPMRGMTLWQADRPHHEPLVIVEWKVNHSFNRASHQKNRREHQQDIAWLCETSSRIGEIDFLGYAVLVEDTCFPKTLTCTRIHRGTSRAWLTLPQSG